MKKKKKHILVVVVFRVRLIHNTHRCIQYIRAYTYMVRTYIKRAMEGYSALLLVIFLLFFF